MIAMSLCYVQKDGKTLMLHRVKKDKDIHQGKWNGLGGKFELGESPEECAVREIKEESGLDIRNPKLKGILSFPEFKHGEDELVFVFVADDFSGELIESDEGDLEWIDNDKLLSLNLWEGDKYFLTLLNKKGIFSGKFMYKDGRLLSHSITTYKD